MTMWSVFFLMTIAFVLGMAGWFLFIWAARSGQFDDPEGPKYRMLEDDDIEHEEHDQDRDYEPFDESPDHKTEDDEAAR